MLFENCDPILLTRWSAQGPRAAAAQYGSVTFCSAYTAKETAGSFVSQHLIYNAVPVRQAGSGMLKNCALPGRGSYSPSTQTEPAERVLGRHT